MSFHMRPSRVLKKMREGGVATSTKLNLSDLRVVEIAAMSGFDCLWIDMEHVPNNMDFVENAVRTAKAYDVDILTRTCRGGYNNYIRPLEADSTGIMVPHLMGLEDAKTINYYTKFHPIGRRPIDGGNADGKYCLIDANEYMAEANRERFVICQIEDPEPLKELEEIADVPGIDMLFFGPADFSQGAGFPNQFDNPELIRTRQLIARTARKHGKFAGTVGGPGNYDQLVSEGFNFINVGADVVALTDYYLDLAGKVMGRTAKTAEEL